MGEIGQRVILLAGPNGAGKSTCAPALLRGALRVEEFVNADVIARGMSAFRPDSASLDAGRVMMARLKRLGSESKDFAFETTLASRSFAPWIRDLESRGYVFHLLFIWLPSADMAVERVRERVEAGGHAVPEETVRRRYAAGLRNFFGLYRPLARTWRFYDNGNPGGPQVVASGIGKEVTDVADPILWNSIEAEYGP